MKWKQIFQNLAMNEDGSTRNEAILVWLFGSIPLSVLLVLGIHFSPGSPEISELSGLLSPFWFFPSWQS